MECNHCEKEIKGGVEIHTLKCHLEHVLAQEKGSPKELADLKAQLAAVVSQSLYLDVILLFHPYILYTWDFFLHIWCRMVWIYTDLSLSLSLSLCVCVYYLVH